MKLLFDHKDEIRARLPEYVDTVTQPDPNQRGHYICPLCGSGTGKGHGKPDGAFGILPNRINWHCFACDTTGDVFDLIGIIENIPDFKGQYKRALELFDYAEEESMSTSTPEEDFGTNPAVRDDIERFSSSLPGSEGEAYLQSRGLSDSIIAALHLGYNAASRCITIPYPGEDYYVSRSIVDKDYKKPGGVSEPLFWIGKDKAALTVFITEGQIDAISLFQSGATSVISLGGVGYTKLRDMPLPQRVIYVRDNDEAGQNAAKNVVKLLEEKGIHHTLIVAPPKGVKDSNDLLREDPEKLKELVKSWSEKMLIKAPPDNVTQYMSTAFDNELVRFRSYKDRKTGFDNLDREIECLYPGLYVLGAISSLGKTTFAHQLADQLVQRGESVVYFTLEQSRMEMVTKGISRITALKAITPNVRTKGASGISSIESVGATDGMDDRNLDQHAVSAIEIRRGATDPYKQKIVDSATKEYMEGSKSLYMVQCDFDTTVETVQSYVSAFIKEKKIRPVVIVDYLQIIRPTDTRMTTKDAVDSHVRALKMLQRNNDLVLIVISSLNRSNYMAPIDFESFKESGGIEYTADVIWGLQLSIMNNSTFNSSQEVIKKRQIVKAAKKSIPRKVQLVCLKNRYGRSSYECDFDYYPQFDLFIPGAPSEFDDMPEDIGTMIEQLGKKRTARKKVKDAAIAEECDDMDETPWEEEENFLTGLSLPPEL